MVLSTTALGAPARMSIAAPSGGRQQLTLQGAPSGIRVQFIEGVKTLGVVAVDSSGTAQLNIGAFPAGPHTVRVVKWGTRENAVEPLKFAVRARSADRLAFSATNANGMPADVFVSGDLHGDGRMELILAGPGGISLIHKRDGVLSAPQLLKGTRGGTPTAIAVFDANGDGRNDLAISYADGHVAVLLNHGEDVFSAAHSYTAGAHPCAIAAADFNGDGIPDLAIANQESNDISILYGNGDGTFQFAKTIPAGYSPRAIVAADFNGDGVPDLATANFSTNDVSILLGDGHGGFLAPSMFAVGSGPVSLVAADFNEDGVPDLAVLNQIDGTVSVLLNDGAGVYAKSISIPGISAVAAGDMDGDGHVDLVVHAGDEIQVRRGMGDGTFGEGKQIAVVTGWLLLAFEDHSIDVSIAAIDRNGAITVFSGRDAGETARATTASFASSTLPHIMPHLDPAATAPSVTTLTASVNPLVFGQSVTLTAAVAPASATGKVTFYDGTTLLGSRTLSNGQATLTTTMLPANAQSLKAYYAGNANLTASMSAVLIEMVTPQGASGFQAAVGYAAGNGPYGVVVADLNGDGKADLAVVDSGSYPNYTGSVNVYLGNGDGRFQSPTVYSTGTGSSFIVAADVDGDGNPDLVVANWSGSVTVLRGNGNGTFQGARTYDVAGLPYCLTVADFNGDGIADIAVATNNYSTVILLLGTGTGDFVTGQTLSASVAPEAILAGDFNGDGIADLAVAGSNGVAVLMGTGNANFRPPVIYAAGVNPYSLAAGDFNGDGKVDLAVANLDGGNVSVLIGRGDGTFATPINYTAGINSEYVVVGDFNGDGNADLAVANFGPSAATGGNVGVLYGNGNGTFQPAQYYSAGFTPFFVAVGNLNGDGRADLVAVDLDGGGVDILLGSPAYLPSVNIDTPSTGTLVTSGSVTVTGWALDNTISIGTSIASVVVKVDGNVVGNATPTLRGDVCVVYPGRAGCPNIGFTFTLITTGLSDGSHTITVSATDSDVVPLTGSQSITINVSNQPPLVDIDTPAPGSVVSGVTGVTGWALARSASGTAISSVQVKVDGTLMGNATYGTLRGDVCVVYPGRPGCPNVGYTYQLNTFLLTPGTHTLTVSGTDSDAVPETSSPSITVTVANPPPSVEIDLPQPGTIVSGTVTMSGWALDNTTTVGPGVASVIVKVDGTQVGTATYGTLRGDVCVVYPGRVGCPNVGYVYALDTSKLTAGPHTLTVVATSAVNSADTGTYSVTVTK